jgi:hypothetical protein
MINNYRNIIIRATALIMILFTFTNWNQKVVSKNSHQAIKFTWLIQSVNNNGEVFDLIKDSVSMFFHNYYTLYQLPYTKSYFKGHMDKDYNEIDNKLVRVDTAYRYLIYKEKDKFGYQFDSVDFKKPEKVNIDTFGINRLWKDFIFFQKKLDTLVEKQIDSNGNIVLEKYIYKHRYGDSYADTIYYYFNKSMKGVRFSFSPVMDSLSDSKLVKVRYIYNKVPKVRKYFGKLLVFDIPKKEYRFEISRIPPESPALTKFIDQFISKEKTLYNGN